ncbi:MAG: tetratricopeptide repeat protein [Desulfurivibrionaceae bacterium]|nr:tetratricopeptide repeat protein [Desulfobulbales bacterium]MDT8334351.1 tetratricopeptide repeat protein [Desulfurivibrionaceae bacterium]
MKTRPLAALIVAAALLTLSLGIPSAYAHVEGHMPDSVAEMEYRILLEFKPNDFTTRVKLARVLLNQNKLAEAEREFNKAMQVDPQNIQAHIGLTVLGLKQNRTDYALEMIKKAAKLAPDEPAVYLNYGKVLEADNRPSEARDMYNQGLARPAGAPGNTAAGHDRQDLAEALRALEEKLNGKSPAN